MSTQPDGEFSVCRRGYAPEQVDRCLRHLKTQVALLAADRDALLEQGDQLLRRVGLESEQNAGLRDRLHRLAAVPPSPRGMSERVQLMLSVAHEEATELRARARAKPAALVARATAAQRRTEEQRRALEQEQERLAADRAAILAEGHLHADRLRADGAAAADQARSSAAEEADRIREAARAEADRILADAESRAARTTADARHTAEGELRAVRARSADVDDAEATVWSRLAGIRAVLDRELVRLAAPDASRPVPQHPPLPPSDAVPAAPAVPRPRRTDSPAPRSVTWSPRTARVET
ncbi:MAG TPA: hypothetical protein VGH99_16815 [Pseudonocardia sp.]|jgi:cell division septum initiation protein DivIVA